MADPEKLFTVDVVTPDGLIYSHKSSFIDFRGVDGKQSIMFDHTPLLVPLAIGDVVVRRSQELNRHMDHIAVNGGYLEFSDNHVTIIADSAERARNIDVSRAEAAKKRAEERLKKAEADHDEESVDKAQVAIQRAMNRISVYNTRK